MSVKLTLSPVDRVPDDSRVYHYDELGECVKDRLPRLLETGETMVLVSDAVGAAFEPYDIVKFTDYYRITVREGPPSVRPAR